MNCEDTSYDLSNDPGKRIPPCIAPCGYGYGDINADGFVTQEDADLVVQNIMGMVTLTNEQKIRANVSSGPVDMADVSAISKYAQNVIDTFMVCNEPPPTPDPCEGVVCNPECYGVDKHETVCSEGICLKGTLIEQDSTECGYIPPEPDPEPEPEPDPEPDDTMNILYLLIIAVVIYTIFLR